ncbi:MAG: hypothetical protein ORN54_05660, partial [Cyclobacteriaceae bacterium]|nr:hypothetical protein [Cyclobacteriaceae bacterium]
CGFGCRVTLYIPLTKLNPFRTMSNYPVKETTLGGYSKSLMYNNRYGKGPYQFRWLWFCFRIRRWYPSGTPQTVLLPNAFILKGNGCRPSNRIRF